MNEQIQDQNRNTISFSSTITYTFEDGNVVNITEDLENVNTDFLDDNFFLNFFQLNYDPISIMSDYQNYLSGVAAGAVPQSGLAAGAVPQSGFSNNIDDQPFDRILNMSLSEDTQLHKNLTNRIKVNNETIDEEKNETCTICFDCFKKNEKASTLSCSHMFHTKCIQEWGYYKPNCPICREKIPLFHDVKKTN